MTPFETGPQKPVTARDLSSRSAPTVTASDSGKVATRRKQDSHQSAKISAIAISWTSSATFHLMMCVLLFLAYRYSKVDFDDAVDNFESEIVGTIGEEDIHDDLPLFKLAGEVSGSLVPAMEGDTTAQMAHELERVNQGAISMDVIEAFANGIPGTNTGTAGGSYGEGILLKVPESGLAVTKGSFTAFTIPAKPKANESYTIVIEIRVPKSTRKYRVSDLSGLVVGSDGYEQKLPFDSRAPYATGYPIKNEQVERITGDSVLDVVDNRVQLLIKVPGAAQLVKDQIRIRSKRLSEEQTLTLVFNSASSVP